MLRPRDPFQTTQALEFDQGRVGDYNGKPWGVDGVPSVGSDSFDRSPATENRRISFFFLLALLVCGIFLTRLSSLQLVRGATYRTIAEENRIRLKPTMASRGVLYDRHGELLVQNVPNLTLQVIPGDLPSEQALSLLANKLASVLDEPVDEIRQELETHRSSSFESKIFRDHLPYPTALKIKLVERSLPGLHLEEFSTRQYLRGEAFAHVLGYMGAVSDQELEEKSHYLLTDEIGKAGLERYNEDILRGRHGQREVEVDSLGKEKRVVAAQQPQLGDNLFLSIDAQLQQQAQDSLLAAVQTHHATGGAAIAMDPRSGEILALVSAPTFDNNVFVSGAGSHEITKLLSDDRSPLFNRATNGQYPPGSTIKPFIAAAALAEGVITPRTTIESSGGITIGQWFFPDWKSGGHGTTDVKKAVAESVNTFFYTVGGGTETFPGLGLHRLTKALSSFGFGQPTAIDLEQEKAGFLPFPEWKETFKKERWYIGDTYHLAIGQGDILVTPLQLAAATSAIANGGTMYTPRLVTAIEEVNGTKHMTLPQVKKVSVMSGRALATAREGMRQAVTSGSAAAVQQGMPVAVAGKTGTAQFDASKRTHAWFTSFAPYENPEIVVVVLVEGGGEGHAAALPVARRILERYFTQ